MKVPLSWVREYVKVDSDPEKVGKTLSMAGFPVDEISEVSGETVLLLDVPSNRPDVLSIQGVARELAAITGEKLNAPNPKFIEAAARCEEVIKVDIQDVDLCPRYIARSVMSVTVGPSPEMMQKRLTAIGLRPVNNIVDITNYVMVECGQPLHAFDYKKLTEATIVVRQAKPREKIVAIDGHEYELPQGALVIADTKVPVAIAGVMGGRDSEIGSKTRHVILESALFNPMRIRMSSKALGLTTDSSFRFERQADYFNVDWASRRAAQLMSEVGGGQIAKGAVDVNFIDPEVRQVSLRVGRIPQVLGIEIEPDRAKTILESLGFKVGGGAGRIDTEVPHWRRDIKEECDLIEEVARIEGYDKIPVAAPLPVRLVKRDRIRRTTNYTADLLGACGYREVVAWSFLDEKMCGDFRFWSTEEPAAVVNPDGNVDKLLRRSVIPALLEIHRTHESYKEAETPIFEIGKCYQRVGKAFGERTCLSALDGRGFRHAKGALETVLAGLRVPFELKPAGVASMSPSRACEVIIGGKRRGFIGEVDPEALNLRDIQGDGIACFEIDFDELVQHVSLEPREVVAPDRLLPIRRDVAVIIDEEVAWARLEEVVRGNFPEDSDAEFRSLELFDIYRGKGIPAGKKSFAFSITLVPTSRPLQAEEIDGCVNAVVKGLESELGAKLRGDG